MEEEPVGEESVEGWRGEKERVEETAMEEGPVEEEPVEEKPMEEEPVEEEPIEEEPIEEEPIEEEPIEDITEYDETNTYDLELTPEEYEEFLKFYAELDPDLVVSDPEIVEYEV